jgi:hypothetical protein
MNDTFYRTACARRHHIIGHYLAVQAWIRSLDCIVLDRVDLEFFLGLQRFKSVRVTWLRDDLRPWFAHQEAFYRSGAPSSIHSLFLSRVPIGSHLSAGTMTTEARIQRMKPDAPKTSLFFNRGWLRVRPSEGDMISQLALFSCGMATPEDLKPRKRVRSRPSSTAATSIDVFDIFRNVFTSKSPDSPAK